MEEAKGSRAAEIIQEIFLNALEDIDVGFVPRDEENQLVGCNTYLMELNQLDPKKFVTGTSYSTYLRDRPKILI